MSEKPKLLNLEITVAGEEPGPIAILLEGFTTQAQVDFVMEQFNKFMTNNATLVKQ